MKGGFRMTRLLTAIFFAAMILLTSAAHAEIKIYEGYGETYLGAAEEPDFAKMRARDAAVNDAKNKAVVDLMALALSKNLLLTEDEVFTILNNNAKLVDEPIFDDDTIEHSDKTTVIIFKARVKISVDTDELSNWLKMEQSRKDMLLDQNKTQQSLTDQDRQKIADLQRRAQNASSPEEIAQIKAEFKQLNDNYLALQKYISANEFFSHNRFDDALKLYDEAVALNPNFTYAYNNRGNAY